MEILARKLAIIGQGLIGSSITRAVKEYGLAGEIVVTDSSDKVRDRLSILGFGEVKVAASNVEAVEDADLVVICVPVGQMAAVAKEIGSSLKDGAIVTDVGSVKTSVIEDMSPYIRPGVQLIPAHPLAGTERSGPDNGLSDMFIDRWCIITPPDNADAAAVEKVKQFWRAMGAQVEMMSPKHHDYVLAITSHVPHLIAFTIFHTALRHERITDSEVMKFSAGGFRDFTRIASSNPTMWRDIFLRNKEAILDVITEFSADLAALAQAIRNDEGDKIFRDLSTSRITRRRVIEKEHISVKTKSPPKAVPPLNRPYSSGD